MSPLFPLPKRPKLPPSPVEPLREILREGRQQIEKARSDIRSIGSEIGSFTTTEPHFGTRATEPQEEAPSSPTETKGTACLPCSRDHFLTTSSSLSEGIRFAREGGVKDHEVMRRIRIALQELDIMERIDLAPEETAKLKGKEKELAGWALKQSRDLRHAITAIKDAETMEQAAAKASAVTEEFMSRLWAIPEDECVTCGEVRERLSEFMERRKREGG